MTIRDRILHFQFKVDWIEEDVFEILDCEGSVKSRNHIGGTSPDQVLNAIKTAKLKWQACPKQ